ncbi:uncharacterized protein LOC132543294 [Ylistrum balloti]|uniref:uncharacterized protein LOC132543294 n=1 Tax=Ylistrum balloti TaxID=509963 RepID=UPI002905AA16|nr:uncharacterized protein LOC132543294 [Ylistrum balloti]
MNGLTLAVIMAVCVGATFANTFPPSYDAQDDDWDGYPMQPIRTHQMVTGYRAPVSKGFVATINPGYLRNGFVGVTPVGNPFVRSGLSRVLRHQGTALYPTIHQKVVYPTAGRRYKRSTGTYRSNRYDSGLQYPGLFPRYRQYPRRYPSYPTFPTHGGY